MVLTDVRRRFQLGQEGPYASHERVALEQLLTKAHVATAGPARPLGSQVRAAELRVGVQSAAQRLRLHLRLRVCSGIGPGTAAAAFLCQPRLVCH